MTEENILVPEVKIGYAGIARTKRTMFGRKKGTRLKYRWKTRPYRHQVAGVKKLLSTGWGGALLMAPRTGKTKTLIDYASILHQAGRVNRPSGVCSTRPSVSRESRQRERWTASSQASSSSAALTG